MTLLILTITAAIIGGTWLDWQDAESRLKSPEWVSGIAMAGLVMACLTTISLLFPFFDDQTLAHSAGSSGRPMIWAVAAFVLCLLGLAVASVRKSRVQILVFLTGLLMAAFCLGFIMAV